MEENVQAKFEERLKELLNIAKKKKNVLEYQEINDFSMIYRWKKNSLTKFWKHWNKIM